MSVWSKPRLRRAAAVAAAGWMTACSALQLRNVDGDGFLGDYRRLEAVPDGGSARRYRNPEAHFEAYEAVLLEPVQIWRSPGTRGLSLADGQRLASRLYGLIYLRLSQDFRMVNYPVRNALRIGVALTGGDGSTPFLYTISTVSPRALPVSEVRTLESGSPAGMAKARIEARITDSVSGDVLLEGVYPRVGGDDPQTVVASWSEVDSAFSSWADQLGSMLCEERKSGGCSQGAR